LWTGYPRLTPKYSINGPTNSSFSWFYPVSFFFKPFFTQQM
jgi:hypothetical protein